MKFNLQHWAETHFEIVSAITYEREQPSKEHPQLIKDIQVNLGTGGFYELAFAWTQEFEEKNKDREWDGEFYDEIEDFVNQKLRG